MTNEEAIENLKYLISGDCTDTQHDFVKEIKIAIEALEKQMPKKPTRTRGKYGHTECACCGWVVESFCGDLEQYPFCPNCGQAIDWEVSE